MGSNENVYVEQENKTYMYSSNSVYEYKNNIDITGDYVKIANKIKQREIFIELNDNQIKNGEDYYTSNSKYTIAVNKYGYVKSNLQLLLDGIDNTGTVVFASESEALSCDTATKYSVLDTLEEYRNANGEFEFLLEYPELTGYNRWKQTSNPITTEESVTGYDAVSITWGDYYWGGLCKSSSSSTFIDGAVNNSKWHYAIGAHVAWNSGIPSTSTPVDEVYLWVRIDNLENTGWTQEGLKFDGINDYVLITEMNYENVTLEAVANTSAGNHQFIMGNYENGGCALRIEPDAGSTRMSAYIGERTQVTYTAEGLVKQNKIFCCSGTYDGTRINYRYDSVYRYKDIAGTIATPMDNTYMVLSGNPGGKTIQDNWFSGTIHSARVYDRALTDEEMSVNFLNDLARYNM